MPLSLRVTIDFEEKKNVSLAVTDMRVVTQSIAEGDDQVHNYRPSCDDKSHDENSHVNENLHKTAKKKKTRLL